MDNEEAKLTIREYIAERNTGSIALCHDGIPHIARINFVADEFDLYFVTSRRSAKFKALEVNSKVALTIDDNSIKQFIQYYGSALSVLDNKGKKHAIKLLSQIYPYIKYWVTDPDVCFIKIVPSKIRLTRGLPTKKTGGDFGDIFYLHFSSYQQQSHSGEKED